MMTRGSTRRPQHLRPCMVMLTDEETARFVAFAKSCRTLLVARQRLGLGDAVFDAARGYGRMQSRTRDRVLAALEREEGVA